MTRVIEFLMLVSLFNVAAGCGTSIPLGHEQDAAAHDSSPQKTRVLESGSPDPVPMSQRESAAVEALRERGAEIDLDESGHARIVELSNSSATNDDLKLLGRLARLEAVDITGGKITDTGLVHFKQLQGLQRLYLNDLPVTSDALKNLSHLKKLDAISLRGTKVDDEAVVHLKKLSQLNVLNLAKTHITNEALKGLKGLKNLGTLVLADTAVTGEGFTHLQPLRNLRTLNVDGCKDIDGHLLKLSELPELRMLYVHGCTVSEEEVEKLTDRNGRLAVFGD